MLGRSLRVGTRLPNPGAVFKGCPRPKALRFDSPLSAPSPFGDGTYSGNIMQGGVPYIADCLVVGAGGGGYRSAGGGGQVKSYTLMLTKGMSLPVVVGAGGPEHSKGNATSLGTTVAAAGNSGELGAGGTSGSGKPGGGWDGNNGGGGGGDATAGHPAAGVGGKGGDGTSSNISGVVVYYGGGGGGQGYPYPSSPGPDGLGGGSAPNRGGGAGFNGSGYQGGSGVVVIRYKGPQRATGGVVTHANGYTIHTFTTSGVFAA